MGRILDCLHRLNPCKSKAHKDDLSSQKRQLQSDENVKLILECEQKSKVVITNAQERRKARQLQAKKEATVESDKFREECEKKYKAFCAKCDQENAKKKKDAESDIEKKIVTINEQAAKNKVKAIKVLMDELVKITPQVHKNFLLQKKIHDKSTRT